jgi:hypothetical protein
MWFIIGFSIALANPDRPFERMDDRLSQRHHAQLRGDGPVYGSKYGRIACQVFRDGMIQRYERPLTQNKTEIRRFSATGLPLTRVVRLQAGPVNITVYGDQDFMFNVEDWSSQQSHGLTLSAPESPRVGPDGTHSWQLDEGTLFIASTEQLNPFNDAFTADFEASCRCTLLDRNITWIRGHRALRLRFAQTTETQLRYGDLWAIPVKSSLITVQWVAQDGGLFDQPLAKGRAIVATIDKVSAP